MYLRPTCWFEKLNLHNLWPTMLTRDIYQNVQQMHGADMCRGGKWGRTASLRSVEKCYSCPTCLYLRRLSLHPRKLSTFSPWITMGNLKWSLKAAHLAAHMHHLILPPHIGKRRWGQRGRGNLEARSMLNSSSALGKGKRVAHHWLNIIRKALGMPSHAAGVGLSLVLWLSLVIAQCFAGCLNMSWKWSF